MNQREKILVGLVGLLVVAFALNYMGKKAFSTYRAKARQIESLKTMIEDQEFTSARGARARRTLNTYELRALPHDPQLASSRYREWLNGWVDKAGIRERNIEYVTGRRRGDTYNEYTFSVTCAGRMNDLTQLLFDFYSVDHLHRIKHLSVKPLKENNLALSFTIEALSLPGTVDIGKLVDRPAERLLFDSLDDYNAVIVDRNVYGPGNRPPALAAELETSGFVGREFSYRPRVSDPDRHRLSFSTDGEDLPPGLSIDPDTGELYGWTPEAIGEFTIPIAVTDHGLPPLTVNTMVKVSITEPPPDRPSEAPPTFNRARFTMLTGIIEVGGQPEAWLTSRTEGKLLYLREGDRFTVGEYKGTMQRINLRHVEIASESGEIVRVKMGQSIADGELISPAAED